MNKKTKIVMITMFKNEASVIGRMLESCLPHVDYYVMQNNGSTDGSDEIAKEFLIKNKLSGEIYEVEEGWVGFGWNRDHLIQHCQNLNHECDWILKMDCDEMLEVDSDFDWSILEKTETQAFHVSIVAGTTIYQRAWLWNSKLKWRFNHDPCHETIYCEDPEIGEKYEVLDLPIGFRHRSSNEGQSWSNPFKFVSDSLILEEKMIKENSFNNLYHFWYIGKSYFDSYKCDALPLGVTQQKEFAKRSIYYFEEFLKYVDTSNINEQVYLTKVLLAELYGFIGNNEKLIEYYEDSERHAPERNDHLIWLAHFYERNKSYEKMLKCTSKMMQVERINPYPYYNYCIDTTMYYDSDSGRVQNLHQIALDGIRNTPQLFQYNKTSQKTLFVVDNFYENPDEIREYALTKVEFVKSERWYKGYRSTTNFYPPNIKEKFEEIMGEKLTHFTGGTFQIMVSTDPQVYHFDQQKWAAMVYLTPNAPIESGTKLYKSKYHNIRTGYDEGVDEYFNGDFFDSTKWEVADTVSNFYNRLIIMHAKCVHSAGAYFGNTFETGRLTHLFFFD